MAVLPLIYAPNPIFKKIAAPVIEVDDEIRSLIDDMFATLEYHKALGIGANMVGVLQQIAIVDLPENSISKPYIFINPEIFWRSQEEQIHEEASLCFLGISAQIKRAKAIKMRYLDYNGEKQEIEADGFLATVIQHEVDYLHGITFLDHLSKLKRDKLLKKMQNFIKKNSKK